ncbi:hypothetical protein [Spongiactinospora sp. 9N601]|uniref:hypothetical protein n=1 Tax=Spongiactinospora sp. 9N601 TaxID=3375149 RepID=UPI00379365DF
MIELDFDLSVDHGGDVHALSLASVDDMALTGDVFWIRVLFRVNGKVMEDGWMPLVELVRALVCLMEKCQERGVAEYEFREGSYRFSFRESDGWVHVSAPRFQSETSVAAISMWTAIPQFALRALRELAAKYPELAHNQKYQNLYRKATSFADHHPPPPVIHFDVRRPPEYQNVFNAMSTEKIAAQIGAFVWSYGGLGEVFRTPIRLIVHLSTDWILDETVDLRSNHPTLEFMVDGGHGDYSVAAQERMLWKLGTQALSATMRAFDINSHPVLKDL